MTVAPTLGFEALRWIEAHCIHGPGDLQGHPVRLTDEALRFLLDSYELDPVTGRRRYKRAMLIRPKGWAKSELAAFVALFEALGPCRFDRWTDDGKPVSRPVRTPVVRIVATEESQSGNVYDNVYHNLIDGPLAAFPGLDVGLTRILLPGGGNLRPVSAGAASKDGGRETFVVFDEIHLFLLPELHRLHATYLRNLRKRTGSEPWSLEISTAYRPGEQSVAETAMQYAAKIQSGDALDAGFLYDHLLPDVSHDLEDPEGRRAALLEAYGDCDWVDFAQIVADWDDPTVDRVDWQRYYLNRVVVTADQFLDPAEWRACADPTARLKPGDRIVLGIDASLVDDATALVACRLSDGFVTLADVWQRPTGRAGIDWQVPYSEVDASVRAMFDAYTVTRLYADPPYLHSYLNAWELDFGEGVRAWATNRNVAMAAALERFFVAVRRGELRHDGGHTLTEHALNARTWESTGRTLVRKDSKHSPRKIDALVAAVLAYEARADAIMAGEHLEPEKPKRGFLSV